MPVHATIVTVGAEPPAVRRGIRILWRKPAQRQVQLPAPSMHLGSRAAPHWASRIQRSTPPRDGGLHEARGPVRSRSPCGPVACRRTPGRQLLTSLSTLISHRWRRDGLAPSWTGRRLPHERFHGPRGSATKPCSRACMRLLRRFARLAERVLGGGAPAVDRTVRRPACGGFACGRGCTCYAVRGMRAAHDTGGFGRVNGCAVACPRRLCVRSHLLTDA